MRFWRLRGWGHLQLVSAITFDLPLQTYVSHRTPRITSILNNHEKIPSINSLLLLWSSPQPPTAASTPQTTINVNLQAVMGARVYSSGLPSTSRRRSGSRKRSSPIPKRNLWSRLSNRFPSWIRVSTATGQEACSLGGGRGTMIE